MFWHIVDHNAPLSLASLKGIFSLHGETVTQAKTRDLLRVECGGQTYYVKRYWTAGKRLRAYFFRSRVKAEWENLQYFNLLKLPVPQLVSYGESRAFFRYQHGAFVMRALPGVQALDDVLKSKTLSPAMRLSLLHQIAEGLQKLHQHKFVHGDCFVRNFLVSMHPLKVHFIDCPRGRHLWGPFLDYGRVRDLASLYKDAQSFLSNTDQLRFFLWYRGESRLSDEGKKMARQVLRRQ